MPASCLQRLPVIATPWVFALLLGGCAVTRVDPPTPAPSPSQFKETALWQRAPSSAVGKVPDEWWTLFNDPMLNELQSQLVIGNENLKSAVAQVASARAELGASRAAQLPTLSAGLSGSRSDSGSQSSSASNQRGPQNSVSLSATAAWELDLWGRLSQATSGSEARYQASVADLASARLSAQATLAQTYLSMRAAEAQQALIERSIAGYQRSLDLTQARYQSGVAAQTDVLQAQTQLKTAQVQGLEAATQRAQLEHALAVLLGKAPSAFSIAVNAALPQAPEVPTVLPATLLERRPDIAAAQQRVNAAYAQIGVADAAFFPALTLSATAGYRNTSLSNLLSAPNLFWSIGPALAQTLLDGGARRSASDQARANADLATSSYRQTVLTAFQEVEDNLVLASQLRAEAQMQQEALQYAQRNLDITNEQYRVGTVSYLNVVTAQTSALSSERTLLDVRNRQLAAVNQLLKNIAGRWQDDKAQ
ncbi:efflux transporter outer membrane subunit [Aquabacterium sp.]|uniref:efflux transporter outer membrane subunit n=1 Tax=Aquabacterium sp. TaxID=1872578 RepID=UPI00198ECF0A|nr:efflux transporter outer membrane subunit [Aquabacterium sp.]MBC7699249.1 efflux transporter outer membrane subunit [Aquabacterium sp.]